MSLHKKKKYSFTPPDHIVRHTEKALVTRADETGQPASLTRGGLSAERAAQLLRTVELDRADLRRRLAEKKAIAPDAVSVNAEKKKEGGPPPAAGEDNAPSGAPVDTAQASFAAAPDTPSPAEQPALRETPTATSCAPCSTVASDTVDSETGQKAEQTAGAAFSETRAEKLLRAAEHNRAIRLRQREKRKVQTFSRGADREAGPPDTEASPSVTARSCEEEARRAALLRNLAADLRQILAKKAQTPPSLRKRLLSPGNLAFAALAALLLVPLFFLAFSEKKLYYIHEDGALAAVVLTDAGDYPSIFARGGLALDPADAVEAEALGSTALLRVTRAYEVSVTADGATRTLKVLGDTAGVAVEKLGFPLGENDLVSPAPDAVLAENDEVVVQRVTYRERTVTEDVAWQEVTKPSPLIREGRTQVMNEGGGRDGVATRTYRETYVDGALTGTEIVAEHYDTLPWNVVTLAGDDDAWMSPIDGSKYTDAEIVDNAPSEYEWVMERGVCTAYSFRPGTYGASGMRMFQGFVAVNTNVIPYGSLLFITSPSGEFTYGWAIAADVGEAMMAGYVDIDLFFETYTESALFGKHSMNVYVVKQLTQDELAEFAAVEGMFRSRIPASAASEE